MNSNTKFKVIYGRKSKRENNTIYVQEEDFQIPVGEESFGVPIRELNMIQKKIINGTPFFQLLSYDDISLWWFIRSSIYPNFKKTINFVTKLSEFIEQTKPYLIEVCDLNYLSIIQQVCGKRNIPLKVSKKSQILFKIKNIILEYIQKYRYKKLGSEKIEKRRNFYFRNYNMSSNIENKILFAVPTIYRRLLLNLETGQSEQREYIQQKIMDFIGDKKNIVGIDLDYTFKGETKTLSERMQDEIHWIPLEALLTRNHNRYSKHKKLMEKYESIIRSKNIHKLFSYNGILLWDSLVGTFKKMKYKPYLPYYLDLYDSLIHTFQEHKPSCILMPYETGPYALALISAARKFGIKTVGIAHAVTDKNNPDYSHDQFANEENPFGFPLPNTTLLFGDFSKRTLVNQGYPSEKFVVFGNPAFFDLNKIEAFLSKKELHLKYKIKNNQKIILFATAKLQEYYSAQGKYNYDTQVWRHLLEHFAGSNEFIILLKPHPQENTEIYEKILQESKVKNAQIIQGDLYELIYISSVVISIFSTFMLDSIVLKKPVIRVEFDKIGHTIPYDEYGVLISTDLKNLSKAIHEVLYDEKVRSTLLENRNFFIKDQYNIPEANPELILKRILV